MFGEFAMIFFFFFGMVSLYLWVVAVIMVVVARWVVVVVVGCYGFLWVFVLPTLLLFKGLLIFEILVFVDKKYLYILVLNNCNNKLSWCIERSCITQPMLKS